MTREKALSDIFWNIDIKAIENYNLNIVDGVWLFRTDVQKYVNKIFDDNEAQLKTKESELESCYMIIKCLNIDLDNKEKLLKDKCNEIDMLKVENKSTLNITLHT